MNLNNIRLSTILIPIGASAIASFVIIWLFVSSLQSNFLQVALILIALTTFPAGIIVWAFEKFSRNQEEVSFKAGAFRQIGFWIAIICFLIIALIAYGLSNVKG